MKRKVMTIAIIITVVLTNFILINRYKKNKIFNSYKIEYKNVDGILDLHNGNLIVKQSEKYGIENIDGAIKKNFEYDKIKRLTDKLYLLFKDGDIAIYNIELDKELKIKRIDILKENLFKVFFNDKYGVINENLELVVENINDDILVNDKFYILKREEKNYLLFKDTKIEKILKNYDEIEIENNEYIYVKKNGLWGMIDQNEKLIIPNEYIELKALDKKLFMGVNKDKKFTFINLEKNIRKILDIDNHSRYSDGYIMILKNGKIGYINEDGEETIKPSYEAGFLFKKNKKFIQLKKDGEWFLLDKNNKNEKYIDYDDLGEFENGYMVVEKNMKFGYIDENGEEKIPLNYLSAENFVENLAVVSKSSGLGVINNKGEKVLNFTFDKVLIDKNFIFVEKDNKHGVFDKTGENKIPIIFDNLIPVDKNNIIFKENKKVGILRIDGEK